MIDAVERERERERAKAEACKYFILKVIIVLRVSANYTNIKF